MEDRDSLDGRVTAPFSSSQVESLNAYQTSGVFHEFTCPHNHGYGPTILVATLGGWLCANARCSYVQNWAHGLMADWSWKQWERRP